ncbi:MAG: Ig-like domain-containing protein, partial [Polyangiales bacterium]
MARSPIRSRLRGRGARRGATAHWLLLLGLAACATTTASKDDVVTAHELRIPEPPDNAEPPAPSGPVQVVFRSPQGEAEHVPEVAVVFDRPMVELGRADETPEPPLTLAPEVEGRTRWIGTQSAVFVPTEPLPRATPFEVRVPAGLEALDGEKTEEPTRWTFSTPRLEVRGTRPYDGARWQVLDREVELTFNQPVDPKRVTEAAKFVVEGEDGKRTLEATATAGEEPNAVVVSAARPLDKASEVTLELAPSLRGEEGPRPLGETFRTRFETYGPLRLQSEQICGHRPGDPCRPDDRLAVRFNQPV